MLSPTALFLSLCLASPQVGGGCDCHAINARYNVVSQPKSSYDYIPIVADDSLGFYVAYSAKQNETNTGILSTACMYVLPLDNDEILIFGGGFGDTWYIPGGAFYDADYDVAMIKEAVVGCMQRDLATTRVRFVAPHGHPDHITVAFVRALERAGFVMGEIAYHNGDRAWIEGLPWLGHHPSLFNVLPNAPCHEEILSFSSPLGHIGVISRPGHTTGSVDLCLDVLGNPDERILIQGSQSGGCQPPTGVALTLSAHGTALVGGPRRAQSEVLPGRGINRTCLRSVTPPKLGESWVSQIEVSGHPGATALLLFGGDCQLSPGLLTPYGELLIDPLGHQQLSIARPIFGGKEYVGVDIPRDPALMGVTFYAQGAVLGGGIEFCNALKLVIGF